MELKDTIELMQSDNFKDRFKAEYLQLKVRYKKLLMLLGDMEFGELQFKPKCPTSLFKLQLGYMEKYIAVLESRAKIEGIDLEMEV